VRTTGYGSGLVIVVLLSVVLYLLRVTSPLQSLALLLLLAGAWTAAFGLASADEADRVYYVGYGAGVAALASFVVIPLRYVLALVLIVVILLIVFTAVYNRGGRREIAERAG
jgi:uncharacterized membrane protein YgaE (UPF0421/DUF939 family)